MIKKTVEIRVAFYLDIIVPQSIHDFSPFESQKERQEKENVLQDKLKDLSIKIGPDNKLSLQLDGKPYPYKFYIIDSDVTQSQIIDDTPQSEIFYES